MKKQNVKGNAGNDLPDYGEKWMEELLKQGKHEIAKFYRLQILYSNRLQEQNRELVETIKFGETVKFALNSQISDLIGQNRELLNTLKGTLPELKQLMEWWDNEAESFEGDEKRMCQNNAGDIRQKTHDIKTIISKYSK